MQFVKVIFFVLFSIFSGFVFGKSVEFLPLPSNDLVRHSYYSISYNEKYEQANWVYYELTDSMVIKGGAERTNKFKADKMVVTGSAKTSDYTKSGYDRGHLCPAADMDFDPVAMEESFLMSNISPQAPEFNRGIWKELETTVREWAKKKHRIFVVAGPVFKDIKGTIGSDKVAVPGYFFKIIYDNSENPEMIAFIFPNERSDRPITDFVVTTDEAEKETGLDFFSQLPDDKESKLESTIELAGWFSGYAPKEPLIAENNRVTAKEVDKNSDLNFYLILILVILLVSLLVYFIGKRRK